MFSKESMPHLKIVVADDSAIYRKLLQNTLASKGYEIFVAQDGREALDLVAVHKPAVVITDWEMPDLTGLELCSQIRKSSESFTYIILLTTNNQKDQIIEGLRSGADDYLTKPFHSGELLARLAVGRRLADLHREILSKNKLLQELSLTDPLTGLPNRRALEEWAPRELRAAARHDFPFWVAVADIDRFKTINDTYGHAAGDLVLKSFAAILKRHTRASNISARIGGEEFVFALSHVDQAGVLTAVERLRQGLAQERFPFAPSIAITASFGVAGFHSKATIDFEALLQWADSALYVAKNGGRNRIELATEFLASPMHAGA
jgi:diguanylate cyclase (GGDEF)-like protein